MAWCQRGNCCLHDIVLEKNIEKLEKALLRPDINLNCEDIFGDTPLVTSLRSNCSDAFVIRLIEAGCDVNKSNQIVSPLHIALTRPTIDVVRKIIQNGANVNAHDLCKSTPLQSAIMATNLDAIHLLLASGADVNKAEDAKRSPLMMALKLDKRATYEIFLHCPDDAHCTEKIASTSTGQIAIDLIKSGANVSCICIDGDFPLLHAMQCGNAALFKLIWSRLSHRILLGTSQPFLLQYVCKSLLYPASEWLQCLYLILTCPFAKELVEECTTATSNKISFVSGLLYRLRKFKEINPRIETLELCMKLGASVTNPDIDLAIGLYGFNQELNTLVYSSNIRKEEYSIENLHPLPTFILALEDHTDANFVFQLFQNQIKSSFRVNDITRALKYFSIPKKMKQELSRLIQQRFPKYHQRISENLQQVPELPTLFELSRNKAREFIKGKYHVEKPHQFHDAVNNLKLPRLIQDVLIFKTPLYS